MVQPPACASCAEESSRATEMEIAERTGRSAVRRAEGDRRNEEEGTEGGGERGRSVSSLPQAAGARAQ